MDFKYVKVEVLLPEEYIVRLRDKLNGLGVLTVGEYDNVVSYSETKGFWRPLKNAKPFNGTVGEISSGSECKMEFRCLYKNVEKVKNTIRSVHPYEEPVVNVLPLL